MADQQKRGFATDVLEELRKVTWPARSEVIRLTSVVILITLAVGIYVGAADALFAKILQLLTNAK